MCSVHLQVDQVRTKPDTTAKGGLSSPPMACTDIHSLDDLAVIDYLCHRGLWTCRGRARLFARPRGHRRRRPREAQRLPARLPRRHHSPIDARAARQLGLVDEFLRLPHSEVSFVQLQTSSGQTLRVSLERVPSKFRYIAFMPQWDFLEFMTRHAMRFPSFTLLRNAEVVDLIHRDGRVTGLRYRDADGEHDSRPC